jgi:hypothetical protein
VSQTEPSSDEDQGEVDIEIRDGKLRTAPHRIHVKGRDLTLRVRSDEFLIVEVKNSELSWRVLPGKVALITLDGRLKKRFEAKLIRRHGVLVLRLDD